MNFICEIKFCDNLTLPEDSKNFNYTWDGNLININTNVAYPCDTNMALENANVQYKTQSDPYFNVLCNSTGEMVYPNEWPQCLSTVECVDPYSFTIPNDIFTTWTINQTVEYGNQVTWKCKDRRYLIRPTGTTTTYGYLNGYCYWKKEYSYYPDQLECILTYCDNATEAPNMTHNYAFSWDNNVIHIDHSYHYPCKPGMRIENDTDTKYQASEYAVVRCGSDGYLRYPDPWPQCSETVHCGSPPDAPVNGSRTWLNGQENQDTYATNIR